MRAKIIFMLILIALVSNTLSYLLSNPLIDAFLAEQQAWVGELLRSSVQSTLTLVIFILFIVIGAREVTLPVLQLTAVAERIANGDYDVEIPQTKRRDEIGVLERSFAAMAKQLRSTEYMQKDFVSNVSHEYRTPLAVMTGYTRLLASGDLSQAERDQFCDFILDEITRLSHMTTNILLLSKLEHQGIMPQMAVYSLDEQIRQAMLLYLQKMQDKNIAFEVDLLPFAICGNEDLMMHVWTNLLENAVKFTDEGGTVRIQATNGNDLITVSISDSGIGMDAETVTHIFNQFYQGDASRQGTGSGLGLALVRRIVELHHGSLRVSSQLGEGTTFSVVLPAH